MKQKKYDEAYRQFRTTLQRMPNRIEAQGGLKLAEQTLKARHLVVPDGVQPYFNRLMLPDYYH